MSTAKTHVENLNEIRARLSTMKSPYAHYTFGDPEYEEFAKGLPGPAPVPRPSLQEIRDGRNKIAVVELEKDPGPQTGLVVQEKQIPTLDNSETLVRIYTPHDERDPSSSSQRYPLLIWIHGGGFCLGSIHTSEKICRTLCVQHQITVINIDYRLAPEYPFPTGLNDCYSVIKWALQNTSEIRAEPARGFIIGGASSGANFTCAVTLMARDDPFFKSYPITGQLLLIPATCSEEAVPDKWRDQLLSRSELYDAPQLDKYSLDQFLNAYAAPSPSEPLYSPLVAESHADLPPAYFQIAGMDPLRDEGILYERVLRESGVKTRIDIYPGVSHEFMDHPITAQAKHREDFGKAIEWMKELVAA